MSLFIRLASTEEATLVHRLLREACAGNDRQPGVSGSAPAEQADDVRAAVQQGGAILATLDGRPVGAACFSLHADHLRVATWPPCPHAGDRASEGRWSRGWRTARVHGTCMRCA